MWNIAQMLPKVRKSAKGCSKCKIVLQTQESAQKVLSAIGKGLPRAKTSLEGKDYGVFEDLPKELYQLRKTQMKKLQNAKHQGSTAYFSRKYPDKLFIDGSWKLM